MNAKTSLTIGSASKRLERPRETCCRFRHNLLEAMNTGVVTKSATSHGECPPDRAFLHQWKKCQPCAVIKVLAMCCHHAVRGHARDQQRPSNSPSSVLRTPSPPLGEKYASELPLIRPADTF